MAEQTFTSRVSGEGRIVIPAELRRLLGLAAGDTVSFEVTETGRVELVNAASLVAQVWANNTNPSDLDAAADVRALRENDSVLSDSVTPGNGRKKKHTAATATSHLLRELGIDS